jgi:hypothetical protein
MLGNWFSSSTMACTSSSAFSTCLVAFADLLLAWPTLFFAWERKSNVESINSHYKTQILQSSDTHHTFIAIFSYLSKPVAFKQEFPGTALEGYKSVMWLHKLLHEKDIL